MYHFISLLLRIFCKLSYKNTALYKKLFKNSNDPLELVPFYQSTQHSPTPSTSFVRNRAFTGEIDNLGQVELDSDSDSDKQSTAV